MEEIKFLLERSLKISLLFAILSFILSNFLLQESFTSFLLISNSLVAIPTFCLVIFYIFSNLTNGNTRSEMYYYNQLLIIFLSYAIIHWLEKILHIPEQGVYNIFNDIKNGNIVFSSVFIVLKDIFTNFIGIYFFFYVFYRMKAIKSKTISINKWLTNSKNPK